AAFMQTLLGGIPVILDCDYLQNRQAFEYRKMLIFTGSIDEFFGFDLGRLDYRGQQRQHTYHSQKSFVQPCGQVNNPYPTNASHLRTLEWKHMMHPTEQERVQGTLLTTETPFSPNDPQHYEYPFPDERNTRLYEQYRLRVVGTADLLICGRLGEYRYYDM